MSDADHPTTETTDGPTSEPTTSPSPALPVKSPSRSRGAGYQGVVYGDDSDMATETAVTLLYARNGVADLGRPVAVLETS